MTPADTALRELLIAAADWHGLGDEDADQEAYTWAVCELADAEDIPDPGAVLRSLGWHSTEDMERATRDATGPGGAQ